MATILFITWHPPNRFSVSIQMTSRTLFFQLFQQQQLQYFHLLQQGTPYPSKQSVWCWNTFELVSLQPSDLPQSPAIYKSFARSPIDVRQVARYSGDIKSGHNGFWLLVETRLLFLLLLLLWTNQKEKTRKMKSPILSNFQQNWLQYQNT